MRARGDAFKGVPGAGLPTFRPGVPQVGADGHREKNFDGKSNFSKRLDFAPINAAR